MLERLTVIDQVRQKPEPSQASQTAVIGMACEVSAYLLTWSCSRRLSGRKVTRLRDMQPVYLLP